MAMNNFSGSSQTGNPLSSGSSATTAGFERNGGWSTLTSSATSQRLWRPYQVTRCISPTVASEFGTPAEGKDRDFEGAGTRSSTANEHSEPEEDIEVRRMRLEAILLLAKTPLSTRKLAQLAHLADGTEARTLVRHLNRCYDQAGRAMRIEQVAGGYRLLTRPAFAPWLARLGHLPAAVRLSSPMMETLAVVAYRQNVSRADVEAVRGVACGEILRQLMERDLVRIAGRGEELGRPYLYGTTKRFLQLFGLSSIEALPPIRWQSFQSKPDARENDEQTDPHPNELTTSMKESVVSTAFVSVHHPTDSTLYPEVDPEFATGEFATGIVSPQHSPVLIDEDDDFDDDDEEDDDLEEDDDFEDDWDDDDDEEEDDDDSEEEDDEVDEWEEVDDADDVEEEDDEDAEDEDAEDDEEDDFDDEDDLDTLDDDDDEDEEDEDEWD